MSEKTRITGDRITRREKHVLSEGARRLWANQGRAEQFTEELKQVILDGLRLGAWEDALKELQAGHATYSTFIGTRRTTLL